jgi:pimeloyl-ACP methyl ester carboxylesterase
MGFSFGAAVAVYTAGVDKRVAACISVGGWGDGAKKFRKQHESPEAWAKFSSMLAEGRRKLAEGVSIRVPRWDIVPIKPGMRNNLSAGSILEFPFEVVESMYTFRANEVVGQIAPRPLLLLHPAVDTVTPTEQSIDLFAHAGQPTDLHLVADVDHFMLAEGNVLSQAVLKHWLDKHFALAAAA